MGDEKITIWQELNQGMGKLLMWVWFIGIGVITKIAVDSRTHKLTWKQIGIKAVLSIFAGIMAAVICENTGNNKWAKVVVPVSTLLGEAIVMYVMNNWKAIAEKVFPQWLTQFNKEKSKNL